MKLFPVSAIRLSLSLALLTLIGLPTQAQTAADFSTMSDGNGGVEILSYTGSATSVVIPPTLGGEAVTGIDPSAFANNVAITSVTIPGSVTMIGNSAFAGCTALADAIFLGNAPTLGGDVFSNTTGGFTVYYNSDATGFAPGGGTWTADPSDSYTSVAITYTTVSDNNGGLIITGATAIPPDSLPLPATIGGLNVTGIGTGAFAGNSTITSVTIPSSITSIGDEAFSDCTALAGVAIPSSVTTLGTEVFANCFSLASVILPETLTSIGDETFLNCGSLTSILIPPQVGALGQQTFLNCGMLASAVFTGNAPVLGQNVFGNAPAGFTVYYGASATGFAMGNGMWTADPSNSYVIASVPYSLDTDGNGGLVLSAYTDIANVLIVPSTIGGVPVTGIASDTFDSSPCTSASIPASITSIGTNPFENCGNLTMITVDPANPDYSSTVDGVLFDKAQTLAIAYPEGKTDAAYSIPATVTAIGAFAFYNTNLSSITIPTGVVTIGDDAFKNSSDLTSVTLPNTVTTMGTSVFQSCTDLVTATLSTNLATIPDTAFFACPALSAIAIPTGVTSIGDNAFNNCTNLASATIPNTVTSIGQSAFQNCAMLGSISIPGSVLTVGESAFQGCTTLTDVTLSTGLTSLGDNAFYGCSDLTGADIPNTVTSLGIGTFQNCTALATVTLSDNIPIVGFSTFSGCISLGAVTIPGSVTLIDVSAFQGCTGLASLTLSPGLATIVNHAFQGCTSLTSVTFPASVTNIGTEAFSGCTDLAYAIFAGDAPTLGGNVFVGVAPNFTVYYNSDAANFLPGAGTWTADPQDSYTSVAITYTTISDNNGGLIITGDTAIPPGSLPLPASIAGVPVTGIGANAFQNSTITGFTIPSSITSIGDFAFNGSLGLTSVNIPATVTSIGANPFYGIPGLTAITVDPANPNYMSTPDGVLFDKAQTMLIAYLPADSATTYSIPGTVLSIGSYAFFDCTTLTSVTIPTGVTSIGAAAFQGCSGLNSVILPNTVTALGASAFNSCSGLTHVTLSNTLTDIGFAAFDDCTQLPAIIIPASITTIEGAAFGDCTALAEAVFLGNAPVLDGNVFQPAANNFTVYYNSDATGFTPGTWEADPDDIYPSVAITYATTSDNNGGVIITGDTVVPPDVLPIPSTIGGLPVTGIAADAFDSGTFVTALIPASVTSIGANPFENCTALTTISVDPANPNYASSADGVLFDEGEDLLISYPAGKSAGTYSVPGTVTSIGDSAFNGCANLTGVTLPTGLTTLGQSAFANSGLLSVTLPNTVMVVGTGTFADCANLASATLSTSLSSIADDLFNNCVALAAITIPTSVTSIGSNSFNGCSGLTSVMIPGSVTSLGLDAFENCSALASANFLGNAPTLGGNVFANAANGFTVGIYPDALGFTSPVWNPDADDSYTVTFVGGLSYSDWINSHPGTLDTDADAAPEGDGVANQLKFLFGIDPSRPMTANDRAALPVFGMSDATGINYLTLTYGKSSLHADVIVNVQTSSDLLTWTTLTYTSGTPTAAQYTAQATGTTDPNGDPYMEVFVPTTGTAPQFIRLSTSQ